MKRYEIRANLNNGNWEDQPQKYIPFKSRKEAVEFCKKLALFLNTEIRLDNNGNGSYFLP